MPASTSIVSKIAVIAFILVSMFTPLADAYFCSDCGPLEKAPAASPSRIVSEQDGPGQGHSDTCPACLSPSLLPDNTAPIILTFTKAVAQDLPRVLEHVTGSIFRPPRIAF